MRFLTGALAVVVLTAYLIVRAEAPLEVRVAVPEQDVPVEVYGLGTVEARVLSRLGFQVGGTIESVSADVGQVVARGEPLVRLDPRVQGARVAAAKAGIGQAESAESRALAQLARARAVVIARRAVSRRRGTLLEKGSVSVEVAEQAGADASVAGADVGVAESELSMARAATEAARARLRQDSTALDLHVLRAPFSATVVGRHREAGATVTAGEAVLTVIDAASVWALVQVDEAVAGSLAVGQPARLTLRSRPGTTVRGRVARIEIEEDRVGEERRVEIAFERVPQPYHLGEQVEANIEVGRMARPALVPESLLETAGTSHRAWVVESGRLARRRVTARTRLLDGRIEVADGLRPGDRLVQEAYPGMREGRRAVAIEEAGLP